MPVAGGSDSCVVVVWAGCAVPGLSGRVTFVAFVAFVATGVAYKDASTGRRRPLLARESGRLGLTVLAGEWGIAGD